MQIQKNPVIGKRAFTLIEVLVVIAIIALLAEMIFPAVGSISKNKVRKKAQAELAQLATAIKDYKTTWGYYPTDNPTNSILNTLYYELQGTVMSMENGKRKFTLKDGTSLNSEDLGSFIGIGGFMNVSKTGVEDGATAQDFLHSVAPAQVAFVTNNGVAVKMLVCTISWPDSSPLPVVLDKRVSPWHYNASNPTNNVGNFDLWVDIIYKGKINRICNWTKQVLEL